MALLFTLLAGCVVFSFLYYEQVKQSHYFSSTQALLDTELSYVSDIEQPDIVAAKLTQHGRLFGIQDAAGQLQFGQMLPDVDIAEPGIGGMIALTYKGIPYMAKSVALSDGGALWIAVDVTKQRHLYDAFSTMRWVNIIAMVLLIVVSYAISRFVVDRTGRIAVTLKKIMDTSDFSQRIDVGSGWDDLSYMALVLNELLDKVEQLMLGIRQVADNIAHDLRTPLTRLKNKLEKHQNALDDTQETAQLDHGVLIEDADNLLKTFNALLRISRIEVGRQSSPMVDQDLSALLEDVLELYEPLMEEKAIHCEKSIDKVFYQCDRDQIFQVLVNLIDNAIKFTPNSGKISITLKKLAKRPLLRIQDTGPGIPHAERSKVFDRFYRMDASRNSQGHGLGLSLVAAVVKHHGGYIELDDANPGLICSLYL